MITIHLHIPSNIQKKRIVYVLAFLQNHPLSPPNIELKISPSNAVKNSNSTENISILYAAQTTDAEVTFFIPAQVLIFHPDGEGKNNINTQELIANKYHWKEHLLFSVEKKEQAPQPFFQNKSFGFDLLETIFFHLSRYEEYHASPQDWDEYDMMQESKQFLVKHQLYQQPILDHLVYFFFEALDLKPQKKATVFQLSHDIDSIRKLPSFYRYARATARLIKDKKGLSKIHQLSQQYWNIKTAQKKDPFDVFDWFLNENINIKKVIYFMAGGTTRYENFYKIEHPDVKKIINKAQKLGYKIGLHPSYLTWKNAEMFQQELKTLEQVVGEKVTYSRQHFLHFSFQDTYDIIEQAGIQNDSTLGYQNLIGFRCGTGFDFHPYHFKKEQAFSFTETPMVVMDCALLTMTNYDVKQAQILLDNFLEHNVFYTKITFNFHNHIFDELSLDAAAMKRLYFAAGNCTRSTPKHVIL